MSSTLTMTHRPSPDPAVSCFALQGSVDVHAGPALDSLLHEALQERLVLDFAAVQRVNSMGLALLLQLFDALHKRRIRVEVRKPNRMISMLFKMTGMQHYLEASSGGTQPTVETPAPKFEAPIPIAPVHGAAAQDDNDRLHFRVSLQSSQHLSGWYFFNTYLQRTLERAIRFEPVHGALGAKSTDLAAPPDLLFAKPFDVCQAMQEASFVPVVRPQASTDEVSIVVRADDARHALADFAGARVVTASAHSFVYLLGRFLVDESGLDSAASEYLFAGQDIKALQMLLSGEADMLFILSESYQGLSGLTRSATRLLDQSETCFAYHLLCLAPQRAHLHSVLRDILLGMNEDEKGRQILSDMHMSAWIPPAREELDMLHQLYRRYANSGGLSSRQDPRKLVPIEGGLA